MLKQKPLVTAILMAGIFSGTASLAAASANDVDQTQEKTPTEQHAAAQKKDATSSQAVKSIQQEKNQLSETLNKSVVEGYKKVQQATELLQQDGKEKEAIALLQTATGQFDTALAANPDLGLVPIDVDVAVVELLTDEKTIKKAIKTAKELLEDNKIQEAAAILSTLKDELVTATAYLPMATYPDAIKDATKALVAGKKDNAQTILATALSTIVVDESIIPLGLVRAEAHIIKAAELDKEKDKSAIEQHLKAAKQQLALASLLGYASKHEDAYRDLTKQIQHIEKEMQGDNAVEALYKKLKTSFSRLIKAEGSQQTDDSKE